MDLLSIKSLVYLRSIQFYDEDDVRSVRGSWFGSHHYPDLTRSKTKLADAAYNRRPIIQALTIK